MNYELEYGYISRELGRFIKNGERNFIIFPYGYAVRMVEDILEKRYGIKPAYIIDNGLCTLNPNIRPIDILVI